MVYDLNHKIRNHAVKGEPVEKSFFHCGAGGGILGGRTRAQARRQGKGGGETSGSHRGCLLLVQWRLGALQQDACLSEACGENGT